MCTLILFRQPGHEWPVLLAANRDELRSRPARPPGPHWPDRPGVVAGLDLQAGGSWLGLNRHGLIAAVLDRRGSLGPAPGKRSRGELVLEALDHTDAASASRALATIDPLAYRPFNLLLADARDAFVLCHEGLGCPRRLALPPGLTMLTAGDPDDPLCPRIAHFRPRFARAPLPDPDRGDWRAWRALLADRSSPTGDPRDALCIRTAGEYGTVSSALIALRRDPSRPAVWLFADGPPDEAAFHPIALSAATAMAGARADASLPPRAPENDFPMRWEGSTA
ncbi:hypothetical protein HRbin40_01705 [bacterium HR40]|nr:hypothetical protein HRbin40_01705 [bacterium HR40]